MIRDMAGRIVRYDDERVQRRDRARAAQFVGPEVFPEAVNAPVVTTSARPCRCGCGRVGVSRDYPGFASRDCLERGEER